ncbi:hypothetical protein [Thalassotalea hakodatensis]|uniref:hypothetical protein n=1 Tax=Thalassotalea hakodatensis TaxID=3030492 RepID=UPI002572CDE7|nr:hypothetical protein [Thalassotalea hakodatensis]
MIFNVPRLLINCNYKYDAFGNAIGNSIVSGLSKSPQPSKEDLERQAKLDAMSRQLGQDASKKVNGVLDANLAKTLGKAQETMAVDLNQTVDNFNNFSSAYMAYSSDYELNVAGQLSDYRVTRANDLTAGYQAKADALTQRTEYYSPDNIYKRVFADDIATGMAMHAGGVRNRPQMGLDFTELNAGLDSTLAWRDQERAEYQKSWVGQTEKVIDVTSKVFNQVREKGEVTLAWGITAGAATGTSVDGAIGNYLALDFSELSYSYGNYFSGELGAELGIPVPDVSLGNEVSIYPTFDWEGALSGKYHIKGVDFEFGNVGLETGYVQSLDDKSIIGAQFTTSISSPLKLLKPLPTSSVYYHVGAGKVNEISSGTLKWWK